MNNNAAILLFSFCFTLLSPALQAASSNKNLKSIEKPAYESVARYRLRDYKTGTANSLKGLVRDIETRIQRGSKSLQSLRSFTIEQGETTELFNELQTRLRGIRVRSDELSKDPHQSNLELSKLRSQLNELDRHIQSFEMMASDTKE